MENKHKYLMYGTIVSNDTFNTYCLINGIINKTKINDGDSLSNAISNIYTGRDGKFVIIGNIIDEVVGDNPIVIERYDSFIEEIVRNSVAEEYDFISEHNEFNYYFVSEY